MTGYPFGPYVNLPLTSFRDADALVSKAPSAASGRHKSASKRRTNPRKDTQTGMLTKYLIRSPAQGPHEGHAANDDDGPKQADEDGGSIHNFLSI